MTALSVLGPLWLIWIVGVISPGPNFFAVTHVAAANGRNAGLLTALGITFGSVFWALTGLFGLKIVFAFFPWAWTIIKFSGAAYLIYVGVKMWRTAEVMDESFKMTAGSAFRIGLLTNLSNPKTAAFAASLLAVAIPVGAPNWVIFAAFCLIVSTVWIWYSLCSLLAAQDRVTLLYKRFRSVLVRVAGTIFVGFGLKLALDR